MGSLSILAQKPMSAARLRLVDAAAHARYTLRDLSAAIGKNPSYLQQYIIKGSPRVLPAQALRKLAEMLAVDESDLIDLDAGPNQPGSPSRHASIDAPARRIIPLMQEGALDMMAGAPIDPGSAIGGGANTVGVQLSARRGMLQPRYIIICDPDATPRFGEMAALVDGNRIAAIGILLPDHKGVTHIMEGAEMRRFDSHMPTWRVLSIICG